jgi:glucose/arabinose dehydrogenase
MPLVSRCRAAAVHSLASILFVLGLATAHSATLPSGFAETRVATGLANPTAMSVAPDGRIFVCEQGGRLRVIKNGALLTQPHAQRELVR